MGQEGSHETLVDDTVPPRTLRARSLDAVAEYIRAGKGGKTAGTTSGGKPLRIVALVGAGMSTAAGIPDFRSPDTGLYANLQRLRLPYPEAVFSLDYFQEHPEPFYVLAQELHPAAGRFHPTLAHAFLALLAAKNHLALLFTQNIDCLERAAGVPADRLVEAHGSFATQRCIRCGHPFPDAAMQAHVQAARELEARWRGLVGDAEAARQRGQDELLGQPERRLEGGEEKEGEEEEEAEIEEGGSEVGSVCTDAEEEADAIAREIEAVLKLEDDGGGHKADDNADDKADDPEEKATATEPATETATTAQHEQPATGGEPQTMVALPGAASTSQLAQMNSQDNSQDGTKSNTADAVNKAAKTPAREEGVDTPKPTDDKPQL
ncbi:sir2 family histone deacetylase [Niveomyces insectorum RCEF 264]|uniref:Sir2 family histone deacetylase n=1 Tax=Niveomyces insectorum RCEF 264 TaxID=1081102 RepID=A0A167ULM7_9HYPO|nr:sir2 family histone deacetylase [Niveomyces insectorum RCEF 264]